MFSRYITSARRLLPWAAIRTCFPDRMLGAIKSCQQGKTRATVSLEAFGERELLLRQVLITRVLAGIARVRLFQRRRGNVVTAAPQLYLIRSILGCRFCFIEALQCTIVPFVKTPVALHGNPHAVHLVQRGP